MSIIFYCRIVMTIENPESNLPYLMALKTDLPMMCLIRDQKISVQWAFRLS